MRFLARYRQCYAHSLPAGEPPVIAPVVRRRQAIAKAHRLHRPERLIGDAVRQHRPCSHRARALRLHQVHTPLGVTAILHDPARWIRDLRDPVTQIIGIGELRCGARPHRITNSIHLSPKDTFP